MSRTCSVSASNMPSRPPGDREEFEIDKSRAKFACSHPIRFESRKSSGSGSGSCSASSSCYPARRPLSIHRRREMRRSSTRKSGSAASVNPSSGSSDSYRSASSKAVSKEVERIDSLFHAYADPSSGLIDPEGIESFCSDLEVDYTDVRILMLAWKMKAEKQGYFTLEEWRRGLQALHADSMAKLKKALSELEKEVARPSNFSDFFTYSFRYCLTEDKQKCIDIESACELIQLVLGSQFPLQVNKLVEYLKYQRDYKVINMDQWTSFLRFCNEINFPSLDNYDEELAWPLILDNFVEWMSERKR